MIWRVAMLPFISGMEMSIKTMSGLSIPIRSDKKLIEG